MNPFVLNAQQTAFNLSLFWAIALFLDTFIAASKPRSNTQAHKSVKWLMLIGSTPILGYLLGQMVFTMSTTGHVATWLLAVFLAFVQLVYIGEPSWRIWARALWVGAAVALLVGYDYLYSYTPSLATVVLFIGVITVWVWLSRNLRPKREMVTQPSWQRE